MFKGLSDEDIIGVIRIRKEEIFSKPDAWASYRFVARKAEYEILRQVMEWGKETCPHDLFKEGTHCFKHACDMCWQELQKQVSCK